MTAGPAGLFNKNFRKPGGMPRHANCGYRICENREGDGERRKLITLDGKRSVTGAVSRAILLPLPSSSHLE